jgi:hypothetical protein
MLSTKFFKALKATGKKIHDVAWEAGVSAGQMYKFTAGIDRPKPGDPRIERLCKIIGLDPDEAFDTNVVDCTPTVNKLG